MKSLAGSKKEKKGTLFAGLLKIDLSKAYDRIIWDFIEAILRKMQFPKNWIQWINQCMSTVSYSILVNGEPRKFFKPSASLRQGDPLSSYLFILCMETLSMKLIAAQISKDIQGIKIASSAPSLTHLFFADDAIFFFKAIPKNNWYLKTLLQDFCAMSGELINYDKSHVIFQPQHTKEIYQTNEKTARSLQL